MNRILKWLSTLKKECPVCTGTGKIQCACNDNHEIACPNCSGKGVVSRQVTTTQKIELPCDAPQCQQGKVICGTCNGSGKTAQGESCGVCHGSGTLNCPVCGGVGRIERVKQESWLEHETCHVCNGRGMVTCYLCNGDKERVCPECKGKGRVLDKGKIAVLFILLLLLLAMPIMVIAVTAIVLSGYVFLLVKAYKKEEECPETIIEDCDGTES